MALYYRITPINELGEGTPVTGSYTPGVMVAGAHASSHAEGGTDPLTGHLAASVAKFKESGGQVLTAGAVADGQFLQRSGTSLIGVSAVAAAPRSVVTVTGNTSLLTSHAIVLVNTTGGDVTISLPSAAVAAEFTIKNTGTGGHRALIDPNGAQTVDASATQELADGDKMTIAADTANTNWQTV